MNKILALYDAEVRANPVSTSYLTVIHDAYVTRFEGAYNFICAWQFSDDDAPRIVGEQAKYFRERGEELMWRVYGHDTPSNIEQCLKREGFVARTAGTFMVLPLDDEAVFETSRDIRPVTTAVELKNYLSVTAEVFGDSDTDSLDYFVNYLSDPSYALFSGYVDDKPVASGLLQMPVQSSFALLFGGSVLSTHRGKGLYRALVNIRAELARKQGLKYMSTEAYDISRPILEKLGFIPLVSETMWVLPAEGGD